MPEFFVHYPPHSHQAWVAAAELWSKRSALVKHARARFQSFVLGSCLWEWQAYSEHRRRKRAAQAHCVAAGKTRIAIWRGRRVLDCWAEVSIRNTRHITRSSKEFALQRCFQIRSRATHHDAPLPRAVHAARTREFEEI